jgi:hypothetical protein
VLDQVAALIWEEAVDADRARTPRGSRMRTGAESTRSRDVGRLRRILVALGLLAYDGEGFSGSGAGRRVTPDREHASRISP